VLPCCSQSGRSLFTRLDSVPGRLRKDFCHLKEPTVPEVRIDAEPRTEFGKGPARRVRRDGKVPAVLYGHHSEPRHVTLPGHEVLMALRTPNVLIRLEGLPGGAQLALPKAVQRHAIQGWVEHVDLILVRRGEKVTVDIPVTVRGEVAPDGLLDQQLVQISVEAEATNIPPGIEVDVEGMEIGAAVHAGDLVLPRGVTLDEEPDVLVLHVIAAPTAEQMQAELGVPEAEEAAAEQPPAPVAAEAPAERGTEASQGGGQDKAAATESS
jgi:large subunit ribosomal protein L25